LNEFDSVYVTEEMIDTYLQILNRRGRTKTTTGRYQSVLYQWHKSLSGSTVRLDEAIDLWKTELKKKKLSERTVAGCVSVLNGFLAYLKEPQREQIYREQQMSEPESETGLSREDYRMLLQTAKLLGRRRPYLLIKTAVCVGIRTLEFQGLTVEGVKQGQVDVTCYGSRRTVPVPEPIRTELLVFAEERGVKDGAIFVTKDGVPLVHSLIWKEVKQICRQMGLPEEKGAPRSLYQLYRDTRKGMYSGSLEEAEERYHSLLMKEEAKLGWN